MLGRGLIFQRARQVVLESTLGFSLKKSAVTLLFSITSWNLRDVAKFKKGISETTAASPSHLRASSVTHKSSFSFFRSMKIIDPVGSENLLAAGGKNFLEALIQIQGLPSFISEDNIPLIKPQLAAVCSLLSQMNSCMPCKGKT
ncbi:hypothetical protein D3C72_1624050 [compost metagenome]